MDDATKVMIQQIVKILARINVRLEYIEDHLGIEEDPDQDLLSSDDDIKLATVLEFAKK